MRVYILVSFIFDGETWLHDLGGLDVHYHSETHVELLDDGYTTECRLGMIFFTWCVVKLYYNVTLCINFHILVVSNDIGLWGSKRSLGAG